MRKFNKIFFNLFLIIFLGSIFSLKVYADDLVSDEIKKIFKEKMDRSWEEASEKEKKIYLRSLEIKKQRKLGRPKVAKRKVYGVYPGDKDGVSLSMRKAFEDAGHGSWKRATDEEREAFKEKYYAKVKRREFNDQQKKIIEENEERQRRQIIEQRKRKIEERRRLKLEKERIKAEKVRVKKEQSRLKMEQAKQRLQQLRNRK